MSLIRPMFNSSQQFEPTTYTILIKVVNTEKPFSTTYDSEKVRINYYFLLVRCIKQGLLRKDRNLSYPRKIQEKFPEKYLLYKCLGAMKQGWGTCGMLQPFNLTYLNVLRS